MADTAPVEATAESLRALCVLCGCLPWAVLRRVSVRRAAYRRASRTSASRRRRGRRASTAAAGGGEPRCGSDTGAGAPRRGIWRTRAHPDLRRRQAVRLLDRPHRRAIVRGQLAERLPGADDVRHGVDRRVMTPALTSSGCARLPQFLRHRVEEPDVVVRLVAHHVPDERVGRPPHEVEDPVEPLLVLAEAQRVAVERPLNARVEQDRLDVGARDQRANERPVPREIEVGRRCPARTRRSSRPCSRTRSPRPGRPGASGAA